MSRSYSDDVIYWRDISFPNLEYLLEQGFVRFWVCWGFKILAIFLELKSCIYVENFGKNIPTLFLYFRYLSPNINSKSYLSSINATIPNHANINGVIQREKKALRNKEYPIIKVNNPTY